MAEILSSKGASTSPPLIFYMAQKMKGVWIKNCVQKASSYYVRVRPLFVNIGEEYRRERTVQIVPCRAVLKV